MYVERILLVLIMVVALVACRGGASVGSVGSAHGGAPESEDRPPDVSVGDDGNTDLLPGDHGDAICPDPRPDALFSGQRGEGTFYDVNGPGSCSLPLAPDRMIAAINDPQYRDGAACGASARSLIISSPATTVSADAFAFSFSAFDFLPRFCFVSLFCFSFDGNTAPSVWRGSSSSGTTNTRVSFFTLSAFSSCFSVFSIFSCFSSCKIGSLMYNAPMIVFICRDIIHGET